MSNANIFRLILQVHSAVMMIYNQFQLKNCQKCGYYKIAIKCDLNPLKIWFVHTDHRRANMGTVMVLWYTHRTLLWHRGQSLSINTILNG